MKGLKMGLYGGGYSPYTHRSIKSFVASTPHIRKRTKSTYSITQRSATTHLWETEKSMDKSKAVEMHKLLKEKVKEFEAQNRENVQQAKKEIGKLRQKIYEAENIKAELLKILEQINIEFGEALLFTHTEIISEKGNTAELEFMRCKATQRNNIRIAMNGFNLLKNNVEILKRARKLKTKMELNSKKRMITFMKKLVAVNSLATRSTQKAERRVVFAVLQHWKSRYRKVKAFREFLRKAEDNIKTKTLKALKCLKGLRIKENVKKAKAVKKRDDTLINKLMNGLVSNVIQERKNTEKALNQYKKRILTKCGICFKLFLLKICSIKTKTALAQQNHKVCLLRKALTIIRAFAAIHKDIIISREERRNTKYIQLAFYGFKSFKEQNRNKLLATLKYKSFKRAQVLMHWYKAYLKTEKAKQLRKTAEKFHKIKLLLRIFNSLKRLVDFNAKAVLIASTHKQKAICHYLNEWGAAYSKASKLRKQMLTKFFNLWLRFYWKAQSQNWLIRAEKWVKGIRKERVLRKAINGWRNTVIKRRLIQYRYECSVNKSNLKLKAKCTEQWFKTTLRRHIRDAESQVKTNPELNEKLETLERDLYTITHENEEHRREISEVNETIKQVISKLNDKETEICIKYSERDFIESSCEILKEDIVPLKSYVVEATNQLSAETDQYEELAVKFGREISNLKEENNTLISEVNKLESDVKRKHEAQQAAEQQLLQTKDFLVNENHDSYLKPNEELEAQLLNSEKELEYLNETLQKVIDKNSALNTKLAQVQDTKDVIHKNKENRILQLTATNNRLKINVEHLASKIKEATEYEWYYKTLVPNEVS